MVWANIVQDKLEYALTKWWLGQKKSLPYGSMGGIWDKVNLSQERAGAGTLTEIGHKEILKDGFAISLQSFVIHFILGSVIAFDSL